MQDINLVALLVAVIGAGGVGAAIREIVSVITKVRDGVAAKESTRKHDLVTQRDKALERAAAAERDRDGQARKRRITEEYASQLRRILIELGVDPPTWPIIDEPDEIPERS